MSARVLKNSVRLARVAVAASLLLLVACEQKITDANYTKITNGMTLSQVEKLLGGSGTDDTSPAGINITGGGVASSSAAKESTYVWKGKSMTIQVIFKDGKVVNKAKL